MTGTAFLLWTVSAMAFGGALTVYLGVAWAIYDDECETYGTAPRAAAAMAARWPIDWIDGDRRLTGWRGM